MRGAFFFFSLILTLACSDSPTTTGVEVASVTLSQAALTLTPQQSATLTAVAKDASGNALPGQTITWATNNTAAATVNNGVVTAVAVGNAMITASAGGKSATANVTVATTVIPVASVSLDQTAGTLVPGQTQTLTATPKDAAGNTLNGRVVTWSSSVSAVATVNTTGVVTAVAAGTTIITTTSEGKQATATIAVQDGAMIGAAGGTINAVNGAVILEVPANALTATTAMSVIPLAAPPAHAQLIPGTAYEFGPNGTTFAHPVTVRIRYETAQVPAGTDPAQFAVHRWNGNSWIPLDARTIDLPNRRISGTTTAFSPFAIIALPPNPAPSVTGISPGSAFAGSPAFTLTVTGTNFVPSSTILWNGQPRTTTFVSSMQLTAHIPASDIVQPATNQITVTTPAPGGGTSAPRTLQVTLNPGVSSVSAGAEHTCGLTLAGQTFCWGAGHLLQLGNNASVPRSNTPIPVHGGLTFTAIATSSAGSCALTQSGQAYCWGSNYFGALGDGSPFDRTVPTLVAGGHTFTSIAAGGTLLGLDAFACATTTAGAIWCWGYNGRGQLGNGTQNQSTVPVRATTPLGRVFNKVVAGGQHVCALAVEGDAWCWGWGVSGLLGNGDSNGRLIPTAVSGGLQFSTIAGGLDHTCAVAINAQGYCWGVNLFGQLGIGGSAGPSSFSLVPAPVVGGLSFSAIAAGYGSTCAISTTGDGYCWGAWVPGPGPANSTSPVIISGGHNLRAITLRRDGITPGACFVTTAGQPWCWGVTSSHYTGFTGAIIFQPTLVPSAPALVQIATGGDTHCGLTQAGTAYCWRFGASGELGNGQTSNRYQPEGASLGVTLTQVSSGNRHSCGVTVAGVVRCWGDGTDGRLGQGSEESSGTGVAIGTSGTFTTVAAGWSHSCAISTTSIAMCWGENDDGQLGAGSQTSSSVPLPIAGFSFASIAVGARFTCGLTVTGAALCWGANGLGQLGVGDNVRRTSPTPVAGGRSYVAIATGDSHACATTAAGQTWCWGANYGGELGNGTLTDSPIPVLVSGGVAFVTVSAGSQETCGLTNMGRAWCWGQNGYGEVGDGTTTLRSSPVPVAGDVAFRSISVGSRHVCGVTFTGTAMCWGQGRYGRLGNGDGADRLVPTLVQGGQLFGAPLVSGPLRW